ncbi:hypothetical protein M514_05330 [Trichuris suis]|uniref:Uncharacterized protein n=1 Tax=Trichuris suis TaxID=68888 RepID=A0A085M9C8_9BILA|nr:hypothetical protein M513_05330 [Trichuris suis]KFD71616.1 hypothetical protein M514_05330 [Trichuris suis]
MMSVPMSAVLLAYAIWNFPFMPMTVCSAEGKGKLTIYSRAMTKRQVYSRDNPIFPIIQHNEDSLHPVYPPILSVDNSPSVFLHALGPYYKNMASQSPNDFIGIVHLLSMIRPQREVPYFNNIITQHG